MKVLICDDDPSYAEDIRQHVSLFMAEKNLSVQCDVFTCGEPLLNTKDFYDMAFLDVEINGISGIDVGHALKKINENIILFVITAYDKYLDDALDLNVLRFLQKPFCSGRFYAGMEKALQQIDQIAAKVVLTGDDGLSPVWLHEILYVEIVDRKTKVVTKSKTFYSTKTMKFWQERLVASFFYQPHKSFIVNLNGIKSFARDTIRMQNGDIVPIAFRKQSQFQKYFIGYFSKS